MALLFVFARSQCSSRCGEGYRHRELLCMSLPRENRPPKVLHPRECDHLELPKDQESCIGAQEDCPPQYRWHSGPWSKVRTTTVCLKSVPLQSVKLCLSVLLHISSMQSHYLGVVGAEMQIVTTTNRCSGFSRLLTMLVEHFRFLMEPG